MGWYAASWFQAINALDRAASWCTCGSILLLAGDATSTARTIAVDVLFLAKSRWGMTSAQDAFRRSALVAWTL